MTVICRSSTLLANDIRMAADFDLPVLISAPPDRALMIATEIAAADRRPRPARVVVCASPADLFRPERAGTRDLMVIREVHEWTRVDQTVVKRLLQAAGPERPARQSRHIVASSSVSLFDRVRSGAFDDGLFYALNAIHIVA
jgi:hypothetical protein